MKAGRLDKMVRLQRRATTVDSVGQPPTAYTTFASVWASVEPTTAKEYRAAQQTVNAMDVLVTIRWRADVLPIDRIKLSDGRVVDVVSVNNIRLANEALELHCLYVAEQEFSGDEAAP